MSQEKHSFIIEGEKIPSALKFYIVKDIVTAPVEVPITTITVDLTDKQGIVELRKFVASINKQIADEDTSERIRQIVREETKKQIEEAISRERRPGGMFPPPENQ